MTAPSYLRQIRTSLWPSDRMAIVRDTDPSPEEFRFFEALSARVPDLQDWYHQDSDGSLWMCVSFDFIEGSSIAATLRLDYDGHRLRGGWSPGFLNWDDGVRAEEAGVETSAPEGLAQDVESPEMAARLAALWFERMINPRRAE